MRIQSERAPAEVRFLAVLADCAGARLASLPPSAPEAHETPETPDDPLQVGPAKHLEPLVQRVRLRNTDSSILRRPPRWFDVAPSQRNAVDDLLSAFEASWTSLLLARYQAEWWALGTEDAVRSNAWRRVEEIEGLLQHGGGRISKDAPGADAGVPREVLLAAVRRVIEDLDMTAERDGFLWIRGGDPAMTESIEGARAKLDAVVERCR